MTWHVLPFLVLLLFLDITSRSRRPENSVRPQDSEGYRHMTLRFSCPHLSISTPWYFLFLANVRTPLAERISDPEAGHMLSSSFLPALTSKCQEEIATFCALPVMSLVISSSLIQVLTYTELYCISCIERFYCSLNQGRIGGQGSGNIDWNPSFRYVNMVLQSRWISPRGGQTITRTTKIRLP
jgi:hypothetical protein